MNKKNSELNCIEAILFDMDGVLIDSRNAWYKAFKELVPITLQDFDKRFWGRDLRANLDDIGADYRAFCGTVLAPHLAAVTIFEDAGKVLDGIKIKKALITNTTLDCTMRLLRRTGLDSKFDIIVTPDDTLRGKPEPDMIFSACERLGVNPKKAIMVGDSAEDMAAGKAAGCITVGVGRDGDHRIGEIKELPGVLEKILASTRD